MTNKNTGFDNPHIAATDAPSARIESQTIDATDDRGGSILGHIWHRSP